MTTNTFSIETSRGVRSFHLHQGDICDSKDEVIVASSHAAADRPPSGEVIRALKKRHEYDFSQIQPLLVIRTNVGTFRVTDPTCDNRTVLVVRFPSAKSAEREGGRALKAFDQVLWTLFGSLSALEFRGQSLRSISLPILAHSRGYPIRSLLEILLKQSIRWLRYSQSTEQISLYILEPIDFSNWNRELDKILGRQYFDSAKDTILSGLRQELVTLVHRIPNKLQEKVNYDGWLQELSDSLATDPLKFNSIATAGRKMAEYMALFYLERTKSKCSGHLYQKIKVIRESEKIAPWVTNYLLSLKDFGNEQVHLGSEKSYYPSQVAHDDLLALMCCILRLLHIWIEWTTENAVS